MISKLAFLAVVCLTATSASAIDSKIGDIQDSRTTGQFFASLKVDIDLIGDDLADAKRLRVRALSAVDDTGRDLMKEDSFGSKDDFEELDRNSGSSKKVSLEFKNPARKAITIKEIKGQIDLFVPKNDPGSIVIVDNLTTQYGKVLQSPNLKALGIEFTALDSKSAEAEQKKKQEKSIADAKASGASEEQIKMFTQFASGFNQLNEKSLVLNIKDPNKKLIGYEVRKGSGEAMHVISTMTSDDSKMIEFDDPIPPNARLVLYVATEKALVSQEFAFNNVTLP